MDYVRLGPIERIVHYGIVWFFGAAVASGFAAGVFGRSEAGFGLAAVSFVLGCSVYVMQRRALKFVFIQTANSAAANYEAVAGLAQSAGWTIVSRREERCLVMSVRGFPRTMASWGERVTIECRGSTVAINSICDPAKHPSAASFGRNRRNVRAVVAAVGA